MPSDRTLVTELATGLGMIGGDDPGQVIAARPSVMTNLVASDWDHLAELWDGGGFRTEFRVGFANGRAFLASPDGLNGRAPRIVEWTGGRRAPGDEVVPADLRIDHVYLVSCKYLSRILHNPSPARLVEGLLAQGPVPDASDWYHRSAPEEYQALYEACVGQVPGSGMPAAASDLDVASRRRLAAALKAGLPPEARAPYAGLCRRASEVTAARWGAAIAGATSSRMLWRLLRIGSAPYFILGADRGGSMRLRIGTPWDWQQEFRLRRLDVTAQPGGQPRVGWAASFLVRGTGEERVVRGHVEIRWSHGRFAMPPEAKVYLDTPHRQVPGYHAVCPGGAR
jgi:hypothetical protein